MKEKRRQENEESGQYVDEFPVDLGRPAQGYTGLLGYEDEQGDAYEKNGKPDPVCRGGEE